jgi:hypothetical protein
VIDDCGINRIKIRYKQTATVSTVFLEVKGLRDIALLGRYANSVDGSVTGADVRIRRHCQPLQVVKLRDVSSKDN